jgi:hypothetical protein
VDESGFLGGSTAQGGHMSSTGGSVVATPDDLMPFKVILTHENTAPTEHAFATMQQCEEFIRRNTAVPPARSTLYDHSAGEG